MKLGCKIKIKIKFLGRRAENKNTTKRERKQWRKGKQQKDIKKKKKLSGN